MTRHLAPFKRVIVTPAVYPRLLEFHHAETTLRQFHQRRQVASAQLRHQEKMLYPLFKPYLQIIWFQGKRRLKKKDNASQGFLLRGRILSRCRTVSTSWLGGLTPFPFEERSNAYICGTSLSLRID